MKTADMLPYGPLVRVRATFGPVLPFNDIVVEVKDRAVGWREVARFNDSHPMCMDDANRAAIGARVKLLEGETP